MQMITQDCLGRIQQAESQVDRISSDLKTGLTGDRSFCDTIVQKYADVQEEEQQALQTSTDMAFALSNAGAPWSSGERDAIIQLKSAVAQLAPLVSRIKDVELSDLRQ